MTQPFALGGNILRINLADRAVTIEPTAPLNARFPAGMGSTTGCCSTKHRWARSRWTLTIHLFLLLVAW
jgi:hypothetical protein